MNIETSQGASGAGEMSRLVWGRDWSTTPLGPVEGWPEALRIAVGICLKSRFPMFVWWGPSLVNIYNDAYAPILGKRHPAALGRPARDVWGEIWGVVGPQAEAVMSRGEATWNEQVLLVMERHGYSEETYFTWSYSPIPDGRGGIGGVFCACTEETGRVLAERERDRMAGQRKLALDAARLGWWRLDPRTEVATYDERFAEIFGVKAGSGPNEEVLARLHPDDVPGVRAAVGRALDPADPRPYQVQYRVVRADGSVRWVEAHGVAAFEGEGPARRASSFVGTVADVSGRKAAEQERERLLAEVRAHHARTAEILESISDAFYAVDAEWRFTYVNRKAEEIWGRRREALVGRNLWSEFPQAVESHAYRMHQKVMAERVPVQFEAVSPVLGRWVDVSIYPEAGGGLSCYFRDVSDRKSAEQALRESEQRLKSVTDALPAFVWTGDADGRVHHFNERWYEYTGLTREQSEGLGWVGALHPDDVGRCVSVWDAARAAGSDYEVEVRYRRRDGAYRYYLARAVPVRDERGAVGGWIGTSTDIDDRRRVEQALRESEGRFRNMSDHAPVMIWVTRPDGYCEYLNRPWLEYTGQELRDALGYGWLDAVHPEDAKRAGEVFVNANASRGAFEVEYRLRRRDGEYRWCVDAAAPRFGDGGEYLGYVGSVIDVHDRKVADAERERLLEAERAARAEAEQASAAKSEFLSVLSHELRTPLTPVLLTVSVLESRQDLPADVREDVASIRRNVELESRLIGDLLDLTRVAKGKLQLDVQDVDVHRAVRAAIDICQREASARMRVELRAGRHVMRGDATRLQQIFWNLVSNAIKFTPAEGEIVVRSVDVEGGRMRVEVTDTGVGIDPEVLPRLFNAFEQGEVRTAKQFAGLGLGLAISRKLAEAHGGTIEVRSEGRGRGATFAVELPVLEASARVEERPKAPAAGGRAEAGRALSVLLVEDHEPTLKVMSRLLRGMGHQVTGATTVASALAAAGQDGFDVIVSDLGLPDGSGLDVMRQLRGRYEGRGIALTGYGMESDIVASREAGFAEHLIKPVDLQQLQAAIGRVAARTPGRGG